jgi:hypothetical protein
VSPTASPRPVAALLWAGPREMGDVLKKLATSLGMPAELVLTNF